MALSNDLMSQFAKATTGDKKKDNETTVYGEVVEVEGRNFVKLDGSDMLTPMSSTADAQPGDRVSILIKNHTATVTGNISSPAARIGSVEEINGKLIVAIEELDANIVKTNRLDAKYAEIDEVKIDKATIEELYSTSAEIKNLYAEKAEIDDLVANSATIKDLKADFITVEQLDAVNADIHNLDATYADITRLQADRITANEAYIEDLQAADAEIANLYATKAEVGDLEADVADIDSLIFGSASGDVIQSSFANAVIAQLGNAQIKSAQIESVSASQITAGDIITNNVRVKSEDGSLLISDETLQISDDTRVRVQIGKDASDDYSINIWDADGNLMFSKGGITDAAIKQAIIRDDMVSDTANIAASKLNINSLFEEINGSSNTIKSTRVYLDDESQTLDVAFTNLTTTTENNTETISSQGTQISTIQGQISNKIWQNDITTAVDNLEIGGRNYFARCKMNNLAWGNGGSDTPNGKIYEAWEYTGYSFPVTPGDSWAIHRTAKTNNRWMLCWLNTEPTKDAVVSSRVLNANDQEPYVKNIFVVPEGITWGFLYLHKAASKDEVVNIPNIMLEKGNKATDWKPAPEDTEGAITTLSNRYSELDQTIDGITATVASHTTELVNKADGTEVTAVRDQVTKVEADLEGFRTKVSDTYATQDSVTELSSEIDQTKDRLSLTVEELSVSGRNLIVRRGELTDTYVDAYGNIIDSATNYKSATMADPIRVEAGAGYTFSKSESAVQYYFRFAWFDKDMNVLGRDAQNTSTVSWTAPSNAAYLIVSYPYIDGANPKLEKGSEATEYTPALEDFKSAIDMTVNNINISVDSKLQDYATTEQMNAAIDVSANGITQSVSSTYTTKTDFNNLQIGGRNLIQNSNFSKGTSLWVSSGVTVSVENDDTHGTCLKMTSTAVGSSTQRIYPSTTENFIHKSGKYALSFYARADEACVLQSNVAGSDMPARNKNITTSWQRFTEIYEASSGSITFWLTEANKTVYLTKIKMENGDKVTDWTPAPEDVDSDIKDVGDAANTANEVTNTRITEAESLIQQLADQISMLVTDENGSSLMTQTANGWTFNIESVQNNINSAVTSLNTLTMNVGSVEQTVTILNQAVSDLETAAEYVRVGKETIVEGGVEKTEPLIELGERDSNFKLKITNTRAMFLDGSNIPTYIDTTGLITENITVNKSIKQKEWVWKVRSNGNLSLSWEEVSS